MTLRSEEHLHSFILFVVDLVEILSDGVDPPLFHGRRGGSPPPPPITVVIDIVKADNVLLTNIQLSIPYL